MNELLKKIYYKIICYDAIIETLDKSAQSKGIEDDENISYVVSPVIITRKQKRQFLFSKDSSNDISK